MLHNKKKCPPELIAKIEACLQLRQQGRDEELRTLMAQTIQQYGKKAVGKVLKSIAKTEEEHEHEFNNVPPLGFIPKEIKDKWLAEGRLPNIEMWLVKGSMMYDPKERKFLGIFTHEPLSMSITPEELASKMAWIDISTEGSTEVPEGMCGQCFANILNYIQKWYRVETAEDIILFQNRWSTLYRELEPYYSKQSPAYPTGRN